MLWPLVTFSDLISWPLCFSHTALLTLNTPSTDSLQALAPAAPSTGECLHDRALGPFHPSGLSSYLSHVSPNQPPVNLPALPSSQHTSPSASVLSACLLILGVPHCSLHFMRRFRQCLIMPGTYLVLNKNMDVSLKVFN